MAHIVYITVGITSHLNASYQLADRLRQRGHFITYLSADPKAAAQIEAQGFTFRLLSNRAKALESHEAASKARSGSRLKRYLNRSGSQALARILYDDVLCNDEVERILAELKPDLLLIDSELHAPIIRTAKLNLPTILLETHVSPRRRSGVPILYSDKLPTGRFVNARLMDTTWTWALLGRRLRRLASRLYHNGLDQTSALRDLARQESFDFARHVDLTQWQLLAYRHLQTMQLSAWEFDFPPPVTDTSSFVGPQIFLERNEPWSDPRYVEVMEALDQTNDDRPLIYCAMGSILSDFTYFKRVIEAFAQQPEWRLVVAVGRRIAPDRFKPLPSNIHLLRYVPQLDILGRAQVMLTHGGIGTINECILFGVPMIVYSGGVMDENGNAARVEYHGLGLRGDLKRESPMVMTQKVAQILDNDTFRQNIQRMQAVYQRYRQENRAAHLIEERCFVAER